MCDENMGSQIFISYAIADSERLHVKEIAQSLARRRGIDSVHCYETWSGYPDGSIVRFMEENIQKSQYFAVFCTMASLHSKNCQKERELAIFQNKRIIPLYEDFGFVPGLCQPHKGVDITDKSDATIVNELTDLITATAGGRKLDSTFKKYREMKLISAEYTSMLELESLVGEEIPNVSRVEWNTFGFVTSDSHVTQLGLYRKGLSSLPDSIGNLTSLKELYLIGNTLNSLPESIGSLTSLEQLSLGSNELSSLPETIGSLTSLKELRLNGNKLSSLPDGIGSLTSLERLYL
ncbi:MAG: TIR domain-containing protein, partial [Candidatus Lokiarchaeota archaeon]|nr:TIR domain-containing protein [Candidatus Lokiarchaeota archaeon]